MIAPQTEYQVSQLHQNESAPDMQLEILSKRSIGRQLMWSVVEPLFPRSDCVVT